MQVLTVDDIKQEIKKRIKIETELRNHPGCGVSGRRSHGQRLSTLTDLLGWINAPRETQN